MEINTRRSSNNMNGPPEHNDKAGHNHQVDGAGDYSSQGIGAKRAFTQPTYPHVSAQQHRQHQVPTRNSTQIDSRQNRETPRSAVTDVLPYCTTEPPLTQEQVITLSDVAGSVKELVLLALTAAAGDRVSTERINAALGQNTANNIIDFFLDEWEVEG
jgi:hypothetical protein